MGENCDFLSLSEALVTCILLLVSIVLQVWVTFVYDCLTGAGDICTQNETTTVWKQSMYSTFIDTGKGDLNWRYFIFNIYNQMSVVKKHGIV